MSYFICPICGGELKLSGNSLICAKKHNFDRSKSGYVNLLMSQKPKDRQHGDDKLMVRSRQAFLDKGYYKPLLDSLCGTVLEHAENGFRILDAGCGECWYTANIHDFLLKNNLKTEMLAVDISKDALEKGAKRSGDIELAVASVYKLPVRTGSCDIALSLFAPCSDEIYRVLKDSGIFIRVFPLEKHLLSLKKIVYDKPYENEIEIFEPDGFALIGKQEIRGKIKLENSEDIKNLFTMTPYYYKTSPVDRNKLSVLETLETETEFCILTYRKNK